ncbi:MAG: phenylalanine--tRNA ligase subunit beta, partial [Nitrospinota bacterium]|nr:phenylalanine--tRNA ligase subunit beta [Nitrospinota bacterium]
TGLSPEEIAVKLTGLGLETSIADDRRGWYQGVVIGKVLSTERHPNADMLTLCKVDVGGETLDIVCGAPNVAAGQTVAVARVGALLPDGMKIEKRKVRGEVSFGMICSESELMLSGGHEGIMTLDGEPTPGANFGDIYEVCDTVLEVDLTPNRADCLSMIGVARELAAVTGVPMNRPDATLQEDTQNKSSDKLAVDIEAPDLCPRYSGRVITGLKAAKSPFWMRRRLTAVGVRAINNLVDVTNYVLMETGHPLHAFDMKDISGGRIIVRRARDGERFATLDGKTHTLSPENLVIADPERAVALAGVMGGENSEVKDTTTDVILEAAFFNPSYVRRTSKRLGIKSESSYRFERGCDVEGLIFAQDRAALLMAALGGGKAWADRVDAYPKKIEKRNVSIRPARAGAVMGLAVTMERIEEILNGLEMKTVSNDGQALTVGIPHFRFDIEREIDLIEEVARFVGYDKVKPSAPEVPVSVTGLSRSLRTRRSLRRHLGSTGLMEGMRYSFVSMVDIDRFRILEGHPWRRLVPIDNPLTSEWTHMRPSLLPGLVSAIKGTRETSVFEIGVVFQQTGPADSHERWMAAVVLTENAQPNLWEGRAPKRDFFHMKGVAESTAIHLGHSDVMFVPSSHPYYYPKRQADIMAGGVKLGNMGQVRPETLEAYEVEQELFAMELDLDAATSKLPPVVMCKKLNKFPSVKRDLAMVVDEAVTVETLEGAIRRHGGALVRRVELFDVYSGVKIGEGKKSVAFSLEFLDETRTLVDDEVNTVFDRIVEGVAQDLGARLR